MRKLFTYLLLISCCLAGWNVNAQDPHYTQAHRIPTWYSPAAAGHGVEHIRLTMLYRNQWSSVMSPFTTQGLFFDKQVSKVGFGANLVNNSAGDAGIRQLFLNGQLSYRYSIGKSVIASGIQIGMIQKSFDPSKMTFDDQYTPDQGANPVTPTSETFSYTKLTRPDFGAGFLWTYGTPGKENFYPYAGISMQHINQPKESFIEQNNTIPRKITANGGVGIVLNEAVTITPMLLYSQQQFAKELLGAVMIKMPLDGRDNVEGGLMFRNKDAVALYAGYQWNNFLLGMSYDVNISGLTGGPGAFELTLTYIPKAKEKKDPAKKKEKEKEKEKKPTQKPKVDSTVKKTSIPTTGSTPPVSVNTPTPKVSEKTTPAITSTPIEPKSNGTGKPTTTAIPKSVIATTPSTSTASPSTKVDKPIVKSDMKTIEKKKSGRAPLKKIVLDPKKSTQPTMAVKSLPLESHDLPNIETISLRNLPKKVNITLPKLQPKKGIMKANNTMPLEGHDSETINPLSTKTTSTLPIVVPILPEVKKTNAPEKLGIPTNATEVPLTMSLMTPKKTTVQKVILNVPDVKKTSTLKKLEIPTNIEDAPTSMGLMAPKKSKAQKVSVSLPEVKQAPVKKTNGLPIEKNDEIVAMPPTLIPAAVLSPIVKDADQDGIDDNNDPCPYIKGSVATGGCPDTDGDGVIDMNDLCPMAAGDVAFKGCPAVNAVSDVGLTNAQHFGNIEFKTSSAVVHGIYKLDIIEPALDSVFLHDDLTLVITGHTDSEGDAQANMELSQARADSVRAIFIKKGMPVEKIQTVAYGETVPLKNNLTEEDKQHNRRVEVHVIRKKNP